MKNFSTVPFHQCRVHGESCEVNVSSGKDGVEVRVAKLKRTNWVCYGLPCSCTLRQRLVTRN